ncbi:MAG: SprT family zinc-dependent metalloprotease [Burkholderiaceae bacterium]
MNVRNMLQFALDFLADPELDSVHDLAPQSPQSPQRPVLVPSGNGSRGKLSDATADASEAAAAVSAPAAGAQTPVVFIHPRANREARLGQAVVGYEFKRGKRRTIGFTVGHEGLVVRAPRWVSVSDVQRAVLEKAPWIVRKLGETRARHERLVSSRIEWQDGAIVPFLGEPMRVVLDPSHAFGAASAVLQQDDGAEGETPRLRLHLALPPQAGPDQIRDAVQAWLMRQGKRVFTERLDHFAPRLQVGWKRLSLSSAGTRWGSARSDGSIRLHWRLIHFRLPVIDYVVAHELSHLRVMDHSPRFWATVRTVVPDYAELRAQLKDESVPSWS